MDILVVDPEAEIRLLFFTAIDTLDCEIYFAASGAEALQALGEPQSIGIVLIATELPDSDACALAERIRTSMSQRHLQIVFLSADENTDKLVELLEHGDDVVLKPFSQPVLLAKLLALQRTRGLYKQIEHHNQRLEYYRQQTEAEHQIASDVFSYINAQNLRNIPGVKTFASSFSVFNGDLLLTAQRPGEGFNVLIADITGHGLPAALGTIPIAETFFAMTEKGFGVGDIAREMNKVFRLRMPDYLFCAAILLGVHDRGGRVQIWAGGMPPLFLFDEAKRVESLLPSAHMALGALSEREFDDKTFNIELRRGQQILCYTDGVTETSNRSGDLFGDDRLIAAVDGEDTRDIFDHIMSALQHFADGEALKDDVTIFAFDTAQYNGLFDAATVNPNCAESEWDGFHWQTAMQFSVLQIKMGQSLPLFFSGFPANPVVRAARADVSFIINELFINALDHGLLHLDSALKEQDDGMEIYFQQRELKLEALRDGAIDIAVDCRFENGAAFFTITCSDTGTGFDLDVTLRKPISDWSHSGRGLRAIAAMSDHISADGNSINVRYRWPRNVDEPSH